MQRVTVDVKDNPPLLVSIQQELNTDPFVKGYKLEVTTDDRTIIITGKVRCYYHKQMANEAVRRVLKTTRITTYLIRSDITVLPEQRADSE